MFYVLLAFTGIFAFTELNDLYTLNFAPVKGEAWYLAVIHYFLSLFPVFTLSTNFPIITITLRNNLKALFLTEGTSSITLILQGTKIYFITDHSNNTWHYMGSTKFFYLFKTQTLILMEKNTVRHVWEKV